MRVGALGETVTVTAETPAGRGLALKGRGPGVVGGALPAPPPPPSAPAMPKPSGAAYARAADQVAGADAAALGDLFEYRIITPVTLAKNQSALVPIVSADVTAEKVSLWSRGGGSGRPLRAVWLRNSSALTLDGGSMAIVDGNAFAGEGLVEPLKPGERRLVSYATDPGTLVSARQDPGPFRIVSVRARHGVITRVSENRATWVYTARNENDRAVTLVVEHRSQPGWKIDEGQAPVESSPDADRFRLVIEPGKEAALRVRTTQSGTSSVSVGGIDDRWIAELTAGGVPAAELERVLQPVTKARDALAQVQSRVAALQNEAGGISEDQTRLRENMKALRGSREEKVLLQRYTRQLNDQEDRLAAIRTALDQANRDQHAARHTLDEAIDALSFDLPLDR